MKLTAARYSELCAVLLVLLSLYVIFYFYIQIIVIDGALGGGSGTADEVDDLLFRQRSSSSLRHNNKNNHNHFFNSPSKRIIIQPFIGSIFNDEIRHYNSRRGTTTAAASSTIITSSSKVSSSSSSVHNNANTARNTTADTTTVVSNSSTNTNSRRRRRVLIISAAPRTKKHLIALWSSLECFTLDVDHVVVSAPTWTTDPLYCPTQMWGRKGCIVENFERQMSRQFPKEKTYGIFPSDVPKNMLSWTNTFHSWVRHPPYWNKLVKEQNFPVSKVNWKGMIDSINDSRLKTCTKFLVGNDNNNGSGGDDEERLSSWLNGFDFSLAKDAI
ncbi:hypothetical protein FRACYDRAFT_250475 [Fragilariopsis cylindrus CCMP1102]|uniref:Nucleotide-diphospho-sugar transferase domain-containing protein n=1 Tax=Fragilariopsis cylindrus CCMP1102 TaxID=635003 RepID=A0A1E7EPJ7_9STRA|nr:hypothetical protein FRACYDRAFT_250475 [Fragilariopsis cylindrus CCMP1102]|eukprot:OEU07851.1 hypothetical protein FRACYDRAFT_250475 [Fragilariopsis cylindrus CCMP1102]